MPIQSTAATTADINAMNCPAQPCPPNSQCSMSTGANGPFHCLGNVDTKVPAGGDSDAEGGCPDVPCGPGQQCSMSNGVGGPFQCIDASVKEPDADGVAWGGCPTDPCQKGYSCCMSNSIPPFKCIPAAKVPHNDVLAGDCGDTTCAAGEMCTWARGKLSCTPVLLRATDAVDYTGGCPNDPCAKGQNCMMQNAEPFMRCIDSKVSAGDSAGGGGACNPECAADEVCSASVMPLIRSAYLRTHKAHERNLFLRHCIATAMRDVQRPERYSLHQKERGSLYGSQLLRMSEPVSG
jgi:hypothetical protein